ncbi:MAG: hypothetical protein JNL70_07360 [Saprospiraceae bacterium]|nr:hypothetical protein [Saprospiraceae bacterium]
MFIELPLLIATLSIAFLHTLTGPDHYLPFIVLAKSRGWHVSRTLFWTMLCGGGHVLSSVALGLGGAALGLGLQKISFLENIRGSLAGWSLLIFGLIYGTWGLFRAFQNKPHKHFDQDGQDLYVYEHKHGQAVLSKERHKVTPWVMFIIFVLGPCEPMIPLLFVPAVQDSWLKLTFLVVIYTIVTLLTMALMVILGFYGFSFIKMEKLERFTHALGGLALLICGLGMVFLEW